MRKGEFGCLALCVLLPLLSFGGCIFHWVTADEVVVRVEEKERVIRGRGNSASSYYEVRTDREIFRNADSWAWWKFDSSDLQRDLRVGGQYRLKVSGVRLPFMSWFRNVVSIHEVVEEPGSSDDGVLEKIRLLVGNEGISNEIFRELVGDLLKRD